MIINVKKELENLDRNNFGHVYLIADKLANDIMEVYYHTKKDEEVLTSLIKDYMIDLINPDLLDMEQKEL